MKRICLIFFLTACLLPVYAQISPVIPSSVSVAGASSAVMNDWSAFHNPAALAHIDRTEIAAQFENRFMMKELSTKSVQAGFNTGPVNVGLSFSYPGSSVSPVLLAGVGFVRPFLSNFSLGVPFASSPASFSASAASRYRGAVLAQFGVASTILPKLTVGFNTFNPFQTNIKTEFSTRRIPSVFSIGTNYAFADNLIWLTQIDKEASSSFRFASGFEYTMIRELTVKLGAYGTDYLIPCLGFGIHLGGFHFNLNGELHPLLGRNTVANLKYRF